MPSEPWTGTAPVRATSGSPRSSESRTVFHRHMKTRTPALIAAFALLAVAAPAQATCETGRKKVEAKNGSTRVVSVWQPRRSRLRYYTQIGTRGRFFHLEDAYAECVNEGSRRAHPEPVYGGPILYRFAGGLLAYASESGGEGGIDSATVKLFDPRRRKLVYKADAAMKEMFNALYTVSALSLQAGGKLSWTTKNIDTGATKDYARP